MSKNHFKGEVFKGYVQVVWVAKLSFLNIVNDHFLCVSKSVYNTVQLLIKSKICKLNQMKKLDTGCNRFFVCL